jgi:hypothetical protein
MDAGNWQKIPLARSLNQFAEKKIRGAMALLGNVLPAQVVSVSNSIVTVKFLLAATTNSPYTLPNVTVPIAGPEYVRMPTQIGDKGVVIPSDVYLGGVSGLGGGTADLSLQANLSSLIFLSIGNKNFSATDDPNAVVIYGPNGTILRNIAKTVTLTLNESGGVVIAGTAATEKVSRLVTAAFEALFNNHTHPSNGSPPTQQMTSAQLTTILTAQ